MLSLLLIGVALAAPRQPCATPMLQSSFPEVELVPRAAPPPEEDKESRDYFDAANAHSSDNFVIRWGNSQVVPSQNIESMLEALETSWSTIIGEMAHTEPVGSEIYRFNVYVADTGVEGPWGPLGDLGAAGWFYPDDGDGYPFMVLSMETMGDLEDGGLTGAHELYHAVQYATGRYREDAAAWLWEASATWIEAEVFEESTDYARFLYGYALLPHLPVDYHAPFESGSLDEYHAYGAFLFPRMLSEHVGDWSLIRDVWVDPVLESEAPLEVIGLDLEQQGLDLWDVFGEFSTRNVGWEYEDGVAYAANLADLPIEFESKSHRFTETHQGSGSQGWDRVPTDLLPGSFGSNLIRLENPAGSTLYARVQAERSEVFQASLVLESSGIYTTHALDTVDGVFRLDMPLTDADAATLVLASIDGEASADTRFSYAYQLSTSEPEEGSAYDSGEAGARSCGCSSSSGSSPGWLWLLGLSALRARRR